MDIRSAISNNAVHNMELCVIGKIVGYQSLQVLEDTVKMGLTAEMLQDDLAKTAYTLLLEGQERKEEPEYFTLCMEMEKRLQDRYKPRDISVYLNNCLSLADQSSDLTGYVSAIIEGYANRRATDALNELLIAHADLDTIVNTVANLGTEFDAKLRGLGATTPEEDYMTFIESYHNAKATGGAVLRTGITGFDTMLGGGIAVGAMTVICARTGEGKSALMLNIAHRLADRGLPILYVTVEMGHDAIWNRRISMETGIRYGQLSVNAQNLSEEEDVYIEKAAEYLKTKPFYMNPIEVITVSDIYRQAMSIKGLRAIFVDYLQIIKPETGAMDDTQGIADVSHGLRALAIKLNVPIITAAQFNRGSGGKDDSGKPIRPSMRNLKGSSAIEQDAHAVIIASRDDYDQDDNTMPRTNQMLCVVHKNRTGVQYAECRLECKMGVNLFWDSESGESQWDTIHYSPLSERAREAVDNADAEFLAHPHPRFNNALPF